MKARAHPPARAVATVASVATHERVAIVASVASAAAPGGVRPWGWTLVRPLI